MCNWTLTTTLHQHEHFAYTWLICNHILSIAVLCGTLDENSLGLGLDATSANGETKVSTFKPQHQMDVSVQRKYADKSPFNIADPCKKSVSQFLQSKSGKEKSFTFSATFPPWQTPRSPASYQEGRTSKSCARHRNVWGSQDGGGGAYTL